jgi:thiamine-phosphate pyrophosphorylase
LFLYYITDRRQLSGNREEGVRLLLARVRLAAEAGIDAIQLRERDLSARELIGLGIRAKEILDEVNSQRAPNLRTRLLINSRIDVAIACGADGVHLRSDDIPASDARHVFLHTGMFQPVVAVSCHAAEEVELAEGHGADFAVFGPVFGKPAHSVNPLGIVELEKACRKRTAANPRMPVLALGSVTAENAADCLQAGAAGVAGIRIFQEGNLLATVSRLRGLDVAGPN